MTFYPLPGALVYVGPETGAGHPLWGLVIENGVLGIRVFWCDGEVGYVHHWEVTEGCVRVDAA